jgi:protein-L-isoaspartate(D-aspartate) O-methyltransferase
LAGAYAWRKVLDAGGRLALGSDFPVEAVDPLLGFFAAITRQDLAGNPPGGWRAEEKLTREEALRGFSLDAAHSLFLEALVGSLEVGKRADLVVFDRDPMQVPAAEVPKVRVDLTLVDARSCDRQGTARDRRRRPMSKAEPGPSPWFRREYEPDPRERRSAVRRSGTATWRPRVSPRCASPRHLFPAEFRDRAYLDAPLIAEGQTISQPYIVALMIEALALGGDEKVLEIGTGSGQQAAVLARLVREVYTIEILEPLARRAQKTFQDMGLRNVRTRVGDGYQGWPEEAPFDAIVVTAAPEKVPQPLLDQLKVGGRMVIPVGREFQDLQLLARPPRASSWRSSCRCASCRR